MRAPSRQVEELVFLLDVDNTLLDNDRVTADLREFLEREVGPEHAARYFEIFEELRERARLRRLSRRAAAVSHRASHTTRTCWTCSHFLIDYPFANRLYPESLDVIDRLKTWGGVVILSDGDVVFQPRKVERSGLWTAVDGNVLIYVHKEQRAGRRARRASRRGTTCWSTTSCASCRR